MVSGRGLPGFLTQPRAMVDAYAAEVAEVGTEYSVIDEREQLAPKAFAALRAVLQLADLYSAGGMGAGSDIYQTITEALEATP